MTQHIIVLCVVALCVAYVVYRIVYAVRNAHGRCYGCQISEGRLQQIRQRQKSYFTTAK